MDDIKYPVRWKRWSERLLSIFPCTCLACRQPAHRLLCQPCREKITHPEPCCNRCGEKLPDSPTGPRICGDCLAHPPPFEQMLFAASYDELLGSLVHQFKYSGKLIVGDVLAALLIEALDKRYADLPRPDLLVPVPLHPRRLRERGFNQSHELAKHIGKRLQIPVARGIISRTGATPKQAGLSRQERRRNVKGAFAINPGRRTECRGKRVAVVDDVVTTGSTVAEVSRLLAKCQPSTISVYTVARTGAE